jgi:hypothetical protein
LYYRHSKIGIGLTIVALAWVKDNCAEGPDVNAPEVQHSRNRKD